MKNKMGLHRAKLILNWYLALLCLRYVAFKFLSFYIVYNQLVKGRVPNKKCHNLNFFGFGKNLKFDDLPPL